MVKLIDFLPKWTKRVVTDSGGRDPLGLSRVAFNLTDFLLTGIITTTERARYYSFYSWVLWHTEQEEKPENYSDFIDAFRRREAVMGLATLASKSKLNPVGVEVLRNQLERGKQTGEYDCNFKVLPSNTLGGYGQYYGSSIYHLKLSYADENAVDRVNEAGADLAFTFHQTIQNTKYIKNQTYLQNSISEADLKELQQNFTLDSIKNDFAENEREKLIEIFFSLNDNYLDDKSRLRRQTLTILLNLISEYGKNDIKLKTHSNYSFDQYLLFAIYYEVLWIDDETISPHQSLKDYYFCYELWKQFCLHQLLTQALEYLLYAVLEAVGHEVTGLSLAETVKKLIQPDFFITLKSVTDTDCNSPENFFSAFGITKIPDESFSKIQQAEYSPVHPQSEARILYLEGKSVEEAAAKAILLLGALYGKWRGMYQDGTMKSVEQTAGHEIWAKRVLSKLDVWLREDLNWTEALTNLIEEFVLNQHDRIMYEKRKIDGWLHRTDGKIIKDQDYKPNWRASRFLNAAKIMADLKIVDITDKKELTITSEGKNLLKQLVR
jgi:hypothetical protein